LFLEANGRPFHGEDADTDVAMAEKIAAGEATPNDIVKWLKDRTSSK